MKFTVMSLVILLSFNLNAKEIVFSCDSDPRVPNSFSAKNISIQLEEESEENGVFRGLLEFEIRKNLFAKEKSYSHVKGEYKVLDTDFYEVGLVSRGSTNNNFLSLRLILNRKAEGSSFIQYSSPKLGSAVFKSRCYIEEVNEY